jgi:uncharacterized membrane protein YhiD involved in acid resistance
VSYFLDQLIRDQDPYLFSMADVLLAMTVAVLLAYVLANVYRATHRGTSYSQGYVHTLFIMAVATSVVMMIIGSNIARAFSLVGALSIIRFRTAVKDARDTGYLFASMVAGMGCGTQFYMPAIVFTAFTAVLMLVLHASEYGKKVRPDNIVRITFRKSEETARAIQEGLRSTFRTPSLLNRLLDFEADHETHVYVVQQASAQAADAFEERMRNLPGVVQVAVYQRDQHQAE